MSDINFVSDGTLERILAPRSRAEILQDVLREAFRQKLKHLADDSEQLIDTCRDLIRSKADVSEELKQLECTANGLLLVALLLKRESAAE